MKTSIFLLVCIALLSCQSSKKVNSTDVHDLKLTHVKDIDTTNPNTYTISLHPNDTIFILDEYDNIVDTLIIN